MKIISLVGARRQFVKLAPVGERAQRVGGWRHGTAHGPDNADDPARSSG